MTLEEEKRQLEIKLKKVNANIDKELLDYDIYCLRQFVDQLNDMHQAKSIYKYFSDEFSGTLYNIMEKIDSRVEGLEGGEDHE
jgi:hypothetical protein